MKIDNKKILILGGLFLLVVMVVLFRSGEKDKSENELMPTPSPTEIETVEVESQTGALYISPTEEEKIVNDSIRILRDSCPIETSDFVLDFDYKRFTFVVKTDNEDVFWTWLDENGYIIPVEDFVIEK